MFSRQQLEEKIPEGLYNQISDILDAAEKSNRLRSASRPLRALYNLDLTEAEALEAVSAYYQERAALENE